MIKLEISKNGRRILAVSPTPISLKGTVPGASFNKGRKPGDEHWSLPLSLTACRVLRERFGDRLEIGPGLWEWARAEVARNSQLRTLADSSDAELLRVPQEAPRLAKAMESRTYQRVGARFIAEGRNVLVADQPGLGKTLEALGGVLEAGVSGPYLVIAPKTATTSVWAKEIPRWLDGQTVVTLPEGNEKNAKQRQRREEVLEWVLWGDEVYDGQPMADTEEALERHEAVLANTWVVVHPEAVRSRVWWRCGECETEAPRKYGKVAFKCDHNPELRRSNRVDHTFPQLFGIAWGAIIVDESDRALLRLSATPTQTRQGMELLRVREDGLRVAMTGTPTRGRPHLMWGQLNWLDERRTPAFWNWVELFWELESNGYTDYIIGKLRREDELWRSLDGFVIRRTKAEVAQDMPAKNHIGSFLDPDDEESPYGVWLPMEGTQAKAAQDMLETTVAELPDGQRVEAIGILAKLVRLKQFASTSGRMEFVKRNRVCKPDLYPGCKREGKHSHTEEVQEFRPELPSNKFEYIVQLLDELGYPDDPSTKVIVVSQFTETLELFARELPARLQALSAHPRTALPTTMTPVLLTGNVSGRKRDEAVESINLPVGEGAHIMFLQTKTGGVAITVDTADVMVFVDETWVPDDQEQAEDRIHRVSNPRPVFYHYLRSLGSIDEGIATVNAERDDANKRLLDGRRGVEYARAILRQTQESGNGVVHPNRGGSGARNGSGPQHGSSAGARAPRALGGTPAATSREDGRRNPSQASRDLPGMTSSANKSKSGKLSRKPGTQHEEATPMAKKSTAAPVEEEEATTRGRSRKIVETDSGERDYTAYKSQPATDLQTRFADWLIDKLEIEFTSTAAEKGFREGVRLGVALRIPFQSSPENQAHRAAKAEEREEQQEEAKPAKAAKAAPAKATKAAKKTAAAVAPEEDEATAATPARRPRKAARSGASRAAF